MTNEPTSRRRHESIPGEARLANLLPTGWTLMSMIGIGIIYATWAWFQIEANATALEKILPKVESTNRAMTGIQTQQLLIKQKLDDFLTAETERRQIETERSADLHRLLQQLILKGSEVSR